MRQLFSQLLQTAKDACVDDSDTTYTGLSDTKTFLKRELNNTVSDIFSLLRKYKLQPPPYTENTVVGQIYYKFRPGFSKLESLTVNIGTHRPPLRIIQSQTEWDYLQQVPAAAGLPTAVFPRRDDFGIYPTPQAVYAMSLTGIWVPVNMTMDDYSTGTVAITNGDETVTLTDGIVPANAAGKWFVVTSNGIPSQNFYRIASRTDNTHFELDRKIIEASASGLSYIIGESPEAPEELHEFIPYRAASIYHAIRRKDTDQAKKLMNFYYTGDFENDKRKGNIRGGVLAVLKDLQEKGRGNSQIIEMGTTVEPLNYIRDGIWGLELTAP